MFGTFSESLIYFIRFADKTGLGVCHTKDEPQNQDIEFTPFLGLVAVSYLDFYLNCGWIKIWNYLCGVKSQVRA